MPLSLLLVPALLAPQAIVTDRPAGGVSLLTVSAPPGTACQVSHGGQAAALPVPGTVAPPQGVASALTCTLPDASRWAQSAVVPPGVHRTIRLSVPPGRSSDAVGWAAEVQQALLVGLDADADSAARRLRLQALDAEARPTVDQLDGVLAALPVAADRRWAAALLGPRLVDPAGAGRLARHFAFAADRAWLTQARAAWGQRAE